MRTEGVLFQIITKFRDYTRIGEQKTLNMCQEAKKTAPLWVAIKKFKLIQLSLLPKTFYREILKEKLS